MDNLITKHGLYGERDADDSPDSVYPSDVAFALADWMIEHTKDHRLCVMCQRHTSHHDPTCLIGIWRTYRGDD